MNCLTAWTLNKYKKESWNMTPLYSTTTIYTYDEYKRFNLALTYNRKYIIWYIIMEAFILLTGCLLNNLFLIVFAIVYPALLVLFPVIQIIHVKKIWKSNKVAQNLNVKFDFYDTYFIETDDNGETR